MKNVYKIIQWQPCVTFHEKERMSKKGRSNSHKVEPRTIENYSESLQLKKLPHLCQTRVSEHRWRLTLFHSSTWNIECFYPKPVLPLHVRFVGDSHLVSLVSKSQMEGILLQMYLMDYIQKPHLHLYWIYVMRSYTINRCWYGMKLLRNLERSEYILHVWGM